MEKSKKAYRVNMTNSPQKYPSGKTDSGKKFSASIIDGLLASCGAIQNYSSRKEANKKAEMFQGVVEPITLKAVKTTFKVWTTIEKCVTYEDGSEKFTDI